MRRIEGQLTAAVRRREAHVAGAAGDDALADIGVAGIENLKAVRQYARIRELAGRGRGDEDKRAVRLLGR